MNRFSRTSVLPALLIAAVLLIVGLAGTATAAKLITGKNIKNNTVTTQDIKNNNLKGADVLDGTLQEKDLGGTVKAKLNKPAVVGYEVVTDTVAVPTAGQSTIFVACSAGKVALGGGADWAGTDTSQVIVESAPQKQIGEFFAAPDGDVATAWKITGEHNSLDPVNLHAYVICVNPS
ncbi:MAG: hypothetical protein Q7J48_14145 [Nocardioides sp.]|nr:hypothetical protein [Nocardioides sp.]